MYKNYVFDLYGTLIDIRTDEDSAMLWDKMAQIYSSLGARYTADELKYEFRRLEDKQKKKLRGRSKKKYIEPNLTLTFKELFLQKDVKCSDKQARIMAITFRTISRDFFKVYDGVYEFLEDLKKAKRKVYLLSNAQSDFTRPEIEMLGLTKYFDGIFISSEQGVCKPSRDFFEKLLKTYKLDPKKSVMIGNDPASDIAGANAVGRDSLYIHTEISPQDYEDKIRATYSIMDGNFNMVRALIFDGNK